MLDFKYSAFFFAQYSLPASTELRELMDGDYFDNPKPGKLLKALAAIGANKDDIVLDFFSGSATTAHALMQLNSEDSGHRT